MIKPFISHERIGLRNVQNDLVLFDVFIHHTPNNIKIPAAMAAAIFAGQSPDNILLSEFLASKDIGVK